MGECENKVMFNEEWVDIFNAHFPTYQAYCRECGKATSKYYFSKREAELALLKDEMVIKYDK